MTATEKDSPLPKPLTQEELVYESKGRWSMDSLLQCLWDCLPIDDEVQFWQAISDKVYDEYFYLPDALSMLVDAKA